VVSARAPEGLERVLGYAFVEPELLVQALTHRSHGNVNNERLEFLGDAALGHVVSEWLYGGFPAAPESDLTLMRAGLVRRTTLAAIAREIDLGAHVRLGSGERRSGGHRRESILADALEAVLGAVLLDGGIEALRAVVVRLFGSHLATVADSPRKDAKTLLQEWLQARGRELPRYTLVRQTGDSHAPRFHVACRIDDLGVEGDGEGGSRREAEQAAAQCALSRLGAPSRD
jgi:ribonuclease-3